MLRIRTFPDPVLRQKAEPVTSFDGEFQQLVDDMAETMYDAPGVGLAANQIGVTKRVFVVDCAGEDEPSDLRVFVNPEITEKEGEVVWKEGCLSFPGVSENVERAEAVHVKALDRFGKPFELDAEGLLAIAIQHESEHLDGSLMIDHLGPVRRRIVQRKLKKGPSDE